MSKISCVVLTETRCVLLVISEEQLTMNAIPKPKATELCQSQVASFCIVEESTHTKSKDSGPYSIDVRRTILILEMRVIDPCKSILQASNRTKSIDHFNRENQAKNFQEITEGHCVSTRQ